MYRPMVYSVKIKLLLLVSQSTGAGCLRYQVRVIPGCGLFADYAESVQVVSNVAY